MASGMLGRPVHKDTEEEGEDTITGCVGVVQLTLHITDSVCDDCCHGLDNVFDNIVKSVHGLWLSFTLIM